MRKATYVHPSGNPSTAKLIIVGEQPGKVEVIKGAPFVGPAGMELDNDLHAAGIARSDCYLTNVIKDIDRPLGHYIESTKKGMIIHPEGQEYIAQLGEELANCKARTIIALGNIAMFALTDRGSGIYKWRGSVLESTLVKGMRVIPSMHPATIIPPKNVFKNKRLLIWDLKRAWHVANGAWKPLERHIIIRPTFNQVMQFLAACGQYGHLYNPIAYDIEVDVIHGEMTCISFAYSPTEAISIPFIAEGGDYFTIPQEAEILKKIAEILEDPEIPKVGQNLAFDSHYMLRKYGIHAQNLHDTMIAQRTLMPDYPMGLHFICSLYTDLPYYKDDGKYWLKGIGTFESGWKYNALDSIVCVEALPKQLKDLERQQNMSAYNRKCKSISPYTYIMERGIKVNLGSMTQAYHEMGLEIENTLKKLQDLCGFSINPNSPKQVADYFYGAKRLPVYKNKTGGTSTDEKALKRIARKGYKEASLILTLRGLTKERSTYLNPEKVDTDSRMRCSVNPVGTRFSRVSTSENIFGTGNNIQNQPHHILQHFLADSYYVYYGPDLGQAENRIVAQVGRIQEMIDAFERGEDVHSLTARIMMNIFYGKEAAAGMDPRTTIAPIGGEVKKCWRDWGKKANHGLNYDLGFKTFALYNEIPERDAKMIVDIYHRAYPGVRNGFHAYVKQCITKNRTLTNLMGRKTVFLDRMDDALFKDAYACIPQGTVGDVIDQRGINFCYYNHDPIFRYVEILIQVHDQIGFQIPTPFHPTTPVPWKAHSHILKSIKKSLETPLYTHYGTTFVIPADFFMGVHLNKDAEDSGLSHKGNPSAKVKDFGPDNLEKLYYEVIKTWLPMIRTAF
jgi:uracil-DNA glycosylase family 4